jgi:hypothetical protein
MGVTVYPHPKRNNVIAINALKHQRQRDQWRAACIASVCINLSLLGILWIMMKF